MLDASRESGVAGAMLDAVDETLLLSVARRARGQGLDLEQFTSALLEQTVAWHFGRTPGWTEDCSRTLAAKLSPLITQDAACRARLERWRAEMETRIAEEGTGA